MEYIFRQNNNNMIGESAVPADPGSADARGAPQKVSLSFDLLYSFQSSLDLKVDAILERIFRAELPIPEFVSNLISYCAEPKDSPNKQLFEAVIQAIIDEMRYVSKYPPSELRITAELIGQLLYADLVTRLPAVAGQQHPLIFTLQGLLEALKRPVTHKLFKFGMIILEQFLDKIARWPVFASSVMQISEFRVAYPRYSQYINNVLETLPPAVRTLSVVDDAELKRLRLPPPPERYEAPAQEKEEKDEPRAAGRIPKAAAPAALVAQNQTVEQLLADPSLLEGLAIPPDQFSDQIGLFFNALSSLNVAEKSAELRALLEIPANKEYQPWLAYYLVKNRVCKESNLHATYLSLLDAVQQPKLFDHVTNLTYCCLRVLLNMAEAAVNSTTHRSIIRNLGSWLGQITIQRNKPLKSKDLDLKQLLLESYEQGRLSVTLPLVCKILSAVKHSRAYKPPNAWTTALISLLAELHDLPGLKTNLLFEIEVLCQGLEIALPDFKRSDLLASRPKPPEESPDFSKRPPQPVVLPVPAAQDWRRTPAVVAPPRAPGMEALQLPQLANMVIIAPSVALFQLQPKLKPLVTIAVDRAIREVVGAVLDRSVNISSLATREIVMKDFYGESDENAVRSAAKLMVASLAGSLALVTCKEPLKVALAQQLKTLLAPASGLSSEANETGLIDQVVQVVSADNLDLACSLLEQLVVERAIKEMDDQIIQALQLRRSAGVFPDMQSYQGSNWLALLPPMLRSRPGLAPGSCYKDFAAGMAIPASPSPPPPVAAPVGPPPPPPPPPVAAPPVHSVMTALRLAAEAQQETAEFKELLLLLSTGLEDMVHRLAANEVILTLPEVVENQPQFLDSYYGLIALGVESEWLQYLRKVEQLLKANLGLCPVLVLIVLAGITERMEAFAAAMSAESFSCSVTEEHLHMEICLALLSIVSGVGLDAEAVGKYLHAPVYATVVYTLHGRIDERLAEPLKTAFLYFAIGCMRYALVKETEMDKLCVRLFTDHRSVASTCFVVSFLYIFVCKMRMSPLSAWTGSIEVIAKLVNRVRETGPANIPPSEKGLAQQLELFMREGKAVANLAVDRVLAYRHLHCLTTSGPQQLPQDVIEFQSIRVPALDSLKLLPDPLKLAGLEKRAAIISLVDQFRAVPEDKRARFWNGLKAVGMPVDQASTEWTEALFQGAVERALELCNGGIDYSALEFYGPFALSLARDAFSSAEGGSLATMDAAKFKIFRRALEAIAKTLTSQRGSLGVNQRVYVRMCLSLWTEFVSVRPESGMWVSGLASQYCRMLSSVGPALIPGFAFGWLELLASREFMAKVLSIRGQRGWLGFGRLIQQAFAFGNTLDPVVKDFNKGVMRVMLVLLHDFPEFLSNYHHLFIAAVPVASVQVRNLTLSAFPKALKLPDPFMQNLRLELLPEVKFAPRLLLGDDVNGFLETSGIKQLLVEYAKQADRNVLATIRMKLFEAKYDAGVMHEFAYFAGIRLPAKINALTALGEASCVSSGALAMDIFSDMMVNMDSEGRYALLCALAAFLRFPDAHTNYYSGLILALFAETPLQAARQQITRVLLERLIVHRPHPWGLLVTFVELIRNPKYSFWQHSGSFLKDHPDVEKVFNNVAATCLGGNPAATDQLRQVIYAAGSSSRV